MKTMNRLNKLAAAALIGLLGMSGAGADPLDNLFRPLGDVKVLATVPAPGFPEGIAVQGNKAYVAGPARFGTAGDGKPSQVFAFDTWSGALLKSYPIQGEDLGRDHANSCLALDLTGRLYVVNLQLGVVRLNPKDGHQEPYAAPLPDLPNVSLQPDHRMACFPFSCFSAPTAVAATRRCGCWARWGAFPGCP